MAAANTPYPEEYCSLKQSPALVSDKITAQQASKSGFENNNSQDLLINNKRCRQGWQAIVAR